MTRDEILKEYDVDARGIIRSPGKFEGEPVYVPYFWDKYLNGLEDKLSGSTWTTMTARSSQSLRALTGFPSGNVKTVS